VACTRLGGLLLGVPGVPRDEVRAIGLLTRACDGSIWSACAALGSIYFDGEHEDLPRAYVAFERACHGGDPLGCASQAILLHHGKGTPRDAERARPLFERACDAGIPFACTGLGQSLLERGPASDRAAARKDFERGCTDAFPAGCYALGVQCAADAFEEACPAVPPLRRACDQGFAKACAALTALLEKQPPAR
jgi:TPR repeat protein